MDSIYKSNLYQKYRGIIISIVDLLIVFFSYIFTFFYENGFFMAVSVIHVTKYVIMAMFFVLMLHLVMGFVFQTHKSLWTFTGTSDILRQVLKSLSCFLIMLLFTRLTGLYHDSLLIISELLALFLSLGIRLIYRNMHQFMMNSGRKENAVIVGAGNAGYLMLNEIYRGSGYPYNVVGFLDDYKSKGTIVNGKKVLGTIDEVGNVVKKYDVKHLFIAINRATEEQKKRAIDLCSQTSVSTKIMRFTTENDLNSPIRIDDIEIKDLLQRPSIDLKVEQIGSYLTFKTVCVTGAGGSIGSELCRQIVRFHPKKLIMVDINENALYMLKQEFLRNIAKDEMDKDIQLETLIISIREREEMFKLIEKYHPHVVYHAAAHKHVPLMEDRPMEAIRNNVFGTKNVIDACMAGRVERFIMISTDKAVNPTNVMGATKRMTELILQSRRNENGVRMAAVRFGNVLGSNGSVIPIFKEQIKNGGPVTITDKNITRYFMTIPEAAQLVLQAGYYADNREIFVLDMGEPVKILTLAEKMIQLSGLRPYKDIEIKEIGLRPGEKMYEELSLGSEKHHRTDNPLIFVNERQYISQENIDSRVQLLADTLSKTDDVKEIKAVLMKTIDM